MIYIQLDKCSAKDFKLMQELYKMGVSEEIIQRAYNEGAKRKKRKANMCRNKCRHIWLRIKEVILNDR